MNSKKQLQTDIQFLGSFPTRTLAVGSLILVAASYMFLNVATRLMAQGFQPMTQVYVRIALGTIVLMVLLRDKLRWRHMVRLPFRDVWIVLTMGTIGFSVGVYFITLGALNAKLINVSVIFASVPFFTYIYSYLFLKKTINEKLIVLLVLSAIGIAFVATKSFIPKLESFGIGEWFTLLATATMAWFYVGRKALSNHLNTSEITILVMIVAVISGWFFALIRGETFQLIAFTNPNVLIGLAIGGGINALINPIEIFAFKHLDAVLGSQILLLENVFSLIFGYLIYAEMVSFPEIIGGLIIIGSVYLANKLKL